MRINTNISALNTANKLQKNNKAASSAMEKLSSGLGINKAADNAAGLAISEKMRGQIRGLEQATRNIQDGISLAQTADSGLGQIINPNLQRLRELAVQASNDTLTYSDKQAIQKEVDQIKQEINGIAVGTEFNTIKVLSPPINAIPPKPVTGKADIVFVIDNSGSMSNTQQTIANNINQLVSSIQGKGATDIRLGIMEYTDNDFLIKNFSGSKWSQDVSVVSNEIIKLSYTNRGGTEKAMEALTKVANTYDFRENESSLKTKHIIFVTNEDADDDYLVNSTLLGLQSKEIQVHGVYYKSNYDVAEFNKIVSGTGGKSVDLRSSSWGAELSSVIGSTIGDVAGAVIQKEEMPTITLQVGANSGETFGMQLFDARTTSLGVDDLKVDPWTEAQKAIGKIDQAIEKASSERSKFGAYQNALDHIHSNVENYSINLTAAESRIRDMDMAKGIMETTKNNIVIQAAQSMLAQAQKAPEQVVQLLK